jgi:hypothetical protein
VSCLQLAPLGVWGLNRITPQTSSGLNDGPARGSSNAESIATRLRPLAGFRNALVHGYLRIDPAVLHGVLNDHLDEVREFARRVDAYLGG